MPRAVPSVSVAVGAACLVVLAVLDPGSAITGAGQWASAGASSPSASGSQGDEADSLIGLAPDSPLGLMKRFVEAYRQNRLDEYGRLLATDFRFTFGDSALAVAYPEGWERSDEIASARHLFEGRTGDSGAHLPAASRIWLTMDSLEVRDDPSEPDSAWCYQWVLAPHVRLVVDFADSSFVVKDAAHEFFVVRGDVAVLGDDQKTDADHWYIRRWVERPLPPASEKPVTANGVVFRP